MNSGRWLFNSVAVLMQNGSLGTLVSTVLVVLISVSCHRSDNAVQSAVNLKPFILTSSGRLPIALAGFRLGMTEAEAHAAEPELKALDSTKAGDAYLYFTTVQGFDVSLQFADYRLIKISSSVWKISPDDAIAFNAATSQQFGRPDKDINEGSTGYTWIWIDRDVRAKFEDNEDLDRASYDCSFQLTRVVNHQIEYIIAFRCKGGSVVASRKVPCATDPR